MKYTALLLSTLIIAQGCAILSTKTESMIASISDRKMNKKLLTFKSSAGQFGYICSGFSSSSPNKPYPNFDVAAYDTPYDSVTIQMANIKDSQNKPININKINSLNQLAQIDTIYADWIGVESFMPSYELHYDRSIIDIFIDDCTHSYNTGKMAFIKQIKDEINTANLKAEQHKKAVTTSISNSLKKHNKKGVRNGGELAIQDVLLTNRYQDKAGYHHFLDTKNTAYLIDFSEYIVTQSLSNNKYVLRHIIEDYYAPAIVPPFQLILKTQKQLYEGETPKNGIAIYTGIELHQTVLGTNKQFVSLISLD